MIRGLLIDLWPLRNSPDFRRLWLGGVCSSVGTTMTLFAVSLQTFQLTGSSLAVGGVGLATALPAVLFGLFGGSIVDAVDRRRLVLGLSAGLLVLSGGLAAQAFAGARSLWLLYALMGAQSVLGTMVGPARRTFVPRLLPPERVAAGTALNMAVMHLSYTVGPTLAGLLAGAAGLRVCYLVDAASFLAAMYATFRLPPMPPQGGASRPGARAVLAGLRLIRDTAVLRGALLADLSATVLAMPIALFPVVNAERFGGSPQTLGLLSSALSIGGIVGMALSGPAGRVRRPGLAMLACGAVWGLGLAVFGLTPTLWGSMLALAAAGIADVLSVLFRSTMIQTATPDRFRGRVGAAEYVVGASCPQLGNFRGGAVATLFSPAVSAVSGGLSAVAGAVAIALLVPGFTRYRAAPLDKATDG